METEKLVLRRVKEHSKELHTLLDDIQDEWAYEDHFYRFYHQSFKVYYAVDTVKSGLALFKKIAGSELTLNKWFLNIVEPVCELRFDMSDNDRWLEATRPVLEAFAHVKFFVEMLCKYSTRLVEEGLDGLLPTGWAAILYLFNSRE